MTKKQFQLRTIAMKNRIYEPSTDCSIKISKLLYNQYLKTRELHVNFEKYITKKIKKKVKKENDYNL
jgi:hypothetical protein